MDKIALKLEELKNQVYNINCIDINYTATLIRDINMYYLSAEDKYLLNQYIMMLIEKADLNNNTMVSFLESIINKFIVKNLDNTFYKVYLNGINIVRNGNSDNSVAFFKDNSITIVFLNTLQKTSYIDLLRRISLKIVGDYKVEADKYIEQVQEFKVGEIKYPIIKDIETDSLIEKVDALERENAELQYYLMLGGII